MNKFCIQSYLHRFVFLFFLFCSVSLQAENFNFLHLKTKIPELQDWEIPLALINHSIVKGKKFTADREAEIIENYLNYQFQQANALQVNFDLRVEEQNYPAKLIRIKNPASEQFVYRNKLELTIPGYERKYAFINFNIPNQEDPFWLYSPVLENVRRLSASNRYTGILNSVFSFNDLFGVNYDADDLQLIGQESLGLKVPIVSSAAVSLRSKDQCSNYEISHSGDPDVSLRFLLLQKVFLLNTNPLASVKRQVLYFYNSLPLFAFSFDLKDQPLKASINYYDSQGVLLRTSIFTDLGQAQLDYKYFRVCNSDQKESIYLSIDPASL